MIVRFTMKLAIIQGKTSKLKEKPRNSRKNLQGYGKTKNAVCRKSVKKKAADLKTLDKDYYLYCYSIGNTREITVLAVLSLVAVYNLDIACSQGLFCQNSKTQLN